MIRRPTWIILAIFLVLLVLAWYLQQTRQNTQAETTPTPASQALFEIEENAVTGLRVEDNQGRVVELGKDAEGQWALAEPAALVDPLKADSAVGQVVTLDASTTLESAPSRDLIGLDPPAFTITVSLSDGTQRVIRVGNVTPIETGYYTQVDDGPVQVVSKFGLDAVIGLLDNPPVQATPTAAETATPGTTPGEEETQAPATASP